MLEQVIVMMTLVVVRIRYWSCRQTSDPTCSNYTPNTIFLESVKPPVRVPRCYSSMQWPVRDVETWGHDHILHGWVPDSPVWDVQAQNIITPSPQQQIKDAERLEWQTWVLFYLLYPLDPHGTHIDQRVRNHTRRIFSALIWIVPRTCDSSFIITQRIRGLAKYQHNHG